MKRELTAAEWMDWVSDRMGLLYSGGSSLPPRHPIKVSMLMGLMGGACGWLTAAPFAVAQFVFHTANSLPQFLIVFAIGFSAMGWAVLTPIFVWTGRRWLPSLILNVCASVAINLMGLVVLILMNSVIFPGSSSEDYVVLIPGIAAISLGFSSWTSWQVGQRRTTTIVTTTIVGTIIGVGSLRAIDACSTRFAMNTWLSREVAQLLLSCWGYGLFDAALSMGCGITLWDLTPRPKFVPEELAGDVNHRQEFLSE